MFSAAETLEIAFKFLSAAGILILLRSAADEVILEQLKSFFESLFHHLFTRRSTHLTLVINESSRISRNLVYDAVHLYLRDKVNLEKITTEEIGPKIKRLTLSKTEREKDLAFSIDNGEEIVDIFQRIRIKWRYICQEPHREESPSKVKKFFELSFHKKFKDNIVKDYLPKVLDKAKELEDLNRVVKIYSWDSETGHWRFTIPEHPASFETVAMEPDLKVKVTNDLTRFKERKGFYKKVGRAWKRGYLLYGPPGTGKSTLIAAMANFLKFDIYDLELASIPSNSVLRKALLLTTNKSILVIEDIDCSIRLQDTENKLESEYPKAKLTLSGILNCIDGLWSSCGDEKIVVFTTNHKEKLDPALLRPGRTDMHISMPYCTPSVFRFLAGKYIELEDHELFGEIEEAIETTNVTPAEVAELLTVNDDNPKTLLNDLIQFLEKKRENEDQEESCRTRIDSQ